MKDASAPSRETVYGTVIVIVLFSMTASYVLSFTLSTTDVMKLSSASTGISFLSEQPTAKIPKKRPNSKLKLIGFICNMLLLFFTLCLNLGTKILR